MNTSIVAISAGALLIAVGTRAVADTVEPSAPPPIVDLAGQASAGQIRLTVDASDIERRIVHVRETITGVGRDCVLRYPKWVPGAQGPVGAIDRMAGLTISASGRRVAWARDPVDSSAFHVTMPPGSHALDLQFDYLSPTDSKLARPLTRDILVLEWNQVVLYPAGYSAGRIPVDASVTLPDGWAFATPLQTAANAGTRTDFKRVSLESLVDSPVYAGRHWARNDLGAAVPKDLNLFADRPASLDVQPGELERTCCP
jgi:predicted metalloprotease with PDZ domain